jgi:hypothetical protein|eukprot:COSAG06_NODE_8_length_37897_cov_42.611884_32_plen_74_part_00
MRPLGLVRLAVVAWAAAALSLPQLAASDHHRPSARAFAWGDSPAGAAACEEGGSGDLCASLRRHAYVPLLPCG